MKLEKATHPSSTSTIMVQGPICWPRSEESLTTWYWLFSPAAIETFETAQQPHHQTKETQHGKDQTPEKLIGIAAAYSALR
jgi:hypothetical protein